jgi:hypothetical protein
MGRLLAALIADIETAPAANPANPANLEPQTAKRFADSQDSQGFEVASREAARLLAEIRADATPEELALLDDRQIAIYGRMLRDTSLREQGQVPADENAVAICQSCGPIWLAPEVAEVAPIVAGLPQVLGCPWCFIRVRGMYVPRPTLA